METVPSGGAVMGCYADSVDSMSPRSRGGESWDEPFPPSAAAAIQATTAANASKLRLMCSYGGHIVPRPHDKTLCYLGGETRIVVVDRHSTLADLHARLSRSLLGGRPFSLKYQLPAEDLDSLISVTTDEDLDNMVEEYDRIVAASSSATGAAVGGGSVGKSPRLRLFLFPAKPESAGHSSSISSLLDDSKSETWFVDALNGAMLGRNLSSAESAASSVNCLLGLDDSSPSPNGAAATATAGVPPDSDNGVLFPRRDSSGKLGGSSRHGGQDVHSVPDSPKASSFGSASSTPSLSNLPPIRVRPDDRGPDLRAIGAGLEDHFSQMNVSGEQKHFPQQLEAEGFAHHLQYYPPPPPHPINPIPLTTATASVPIHTNISPTENPNPSRVLSSSDDKPDHGGICRSSPQQPKEQQQTQQQQQQQKLNFVDVPVLGDAISRSGYYQERPLSAADAKQDVPVADGSYRLPLHVTDQGYLLQPPPLPTIQGIEQLQQQQQQAHQQYVQANPHLVHHHPAAGTAIPLSSYYQIPIHPQQQLPKTAHPYNPQVPMYFLPVRQNPAYNLAVQPNFGDAPAAAPISSTGKPTIPLPNAVLTSRAAPAKPELAANVYRTAGATTAPAVVQPPQPTQLIHLADPPAQYVSYHPMHHHQSQAGAAASVTGYGYEYADAVHAQQIYYSQATSPALPSQYQTMSSGAAVKAESPPALQQPAADVKPTRASELLQR